MIYTIYKNVRRAGSRALRRTLRLARARRGWSIGGWSWRGRRPAWLDACAPGWHASPSDDAHRVSSSCAPAIGDLGGQRGRWRLAAIARGAAAAGADVVVLPELITSGYLLRVDAEECAAAAIAADHAILGEWATEAARAGDRWSVGGFCELGQDGKIYNSAALLDADRRCAPSTASCTCGTARSAASRRAPTAPPVVDTRVGQIARGRLLRPGVPGADARRRPGRARSCCAVPTNWPLVPRPDGERPPEAVIAMARRPRQPHGDRLRRPARDRARAGVDGRVDDRRRRRLGRRRDARRRDGSSPTSTWTPALDKRLTELADAFGDRRPELYGSLG